jgi:hypothetical protein
LQLSSGSKVPREHARAGVGWHLVTLSTVKGHLSDWLTDLLWRRCLLTSLAGIFNASRGASDAQPPAFGSTSSSAWRPSAFSSASASTTSAAVSTSGRRNMPGGQPARRLFARDEPVLGGRVCDGARHHADAAGLIEPETPGTAHVGEIDEHEATFRHVAPRTD